MLAPPTQPLVVVGVERLVLLSAWRPKAKGVSSRSISTTQRYLCAHRSCANSALRDRRFSASTVAMSGHVDFKSTAPWAFWFAYGAWTPALPTRPHAFKDTEMSVPRVGPSRLSCSLAPLIERDSNSLLPLQQQQWHPRVHRGSKCARDAAASGCALLETAPLQRQHHRRTLVV